MSKAYELMTQSLAFCSPDDTADHVASIMRDRDIGDVLVMDDGKLLGIVTDRDLTIRAITNNHDSNHLKIRNYMTERVITGSSDWSVQRIARTMAKHQVRRLPIMEDGQVVGIISLGDIARYSNRKRIISNSLKEISANPITPKTNGRLQTGALIGLGLVALTSTAIAMLTWNRSGRDWSKQLSDTKAYHSAQDAVNATRGRIDEVASSKTARNLRNQIQNNMKEISYQLPRIEYKPPKHKPAWYR
jgi:CBS domain-containing protein